MNQDVINLLQIGTTVLLSLGLWFLQDIKAQLKDMKAELDLKTNSEECDKKRESCLRSADKSELSIKQRIERMEQDLSDLKRSSRLQYGALKEIAGHLRIRVIEERDVE